MGARIETRRAQTIIVGAGAAGAVIATRLSERGDHDILLVEAGPDYANDEIPDDLRDGTRNSMTRHDWGYQHLTTPKGLVHPYPRGRVVGGSSAVNTCIALRGQPYDYDEWADRGLSEWSWEKCRPAFLRLENDLDFDNEHHGNEGPVPIRRHPPSELAHWQAAFIDGCVEVGFPTCDDHNDPESTGVGPHAMNKVDGERMSAARCYLTDDVRARENLDMVAGALVRRVLFEGRRAVGVEIERRGNVERLLADRVVLCAGAIGTPGILLRSGVGPKTECARLGVELVADNAHVGARLLDHPGAAILLRPKGALRHSTEDPVIQAALRYQSARSSRPNDMQLQAGSFVPMPFADTPLVSLMCCVGKPKGWGSLRWPSADPRALPRIDMDFLVEPDDLAAAVEAIELAWLVATSDACKDLVEFIFPMERHLASKKAIRDFIPRQCGSGYHPSGTAPMGADDDPEAATDEYGRVRGTDGLFVADASLMPTITSANTHLPTLMIGERFGEWFRDDAL